MIINLSNSRKAGEMDTYLDTVFVLFGGRVLDLNLLLQVIHSIAQLQVVCTI